MFYSLFARHVMSNPHKVAVSCDGAQITYGDMGLFVEKVARNLTRLGVRPSELCCVCFDNCIEYLVLYYALARLGVRVMPVTTTMNSDEIESFSRESVPDYFIVHPAYLDKYQIITGNLRSGVLISDKTRPYTLDDIFNVDVDLTSSLPDVVWSGRDFVIHYNTPNSTEQGHCFTGAVQTHESHAHRMLNWAQVAGITSNDRTLCMHPLMHAFGSEMFALPALSTGQTLYLLSSHEATPSNVGKLIQEHRITLFGALPWFYKELVDIEGEDKSDLSSLRVAMCAATPLPTNVADNFFASYGKRVSNSYGLTETSLIASNLDEFHDMLTVGRPISNVDTDLRDCGMNMLGVGELLVRSNGFSVRYVAEDVKSLWKDGWIHTGDLVRRSEDGNLYILGRVDQIVVTSEGNFLPWEVEEVIACHPKVREVAVVPVRDREGAHVAAFIVPNDGFLDEGDIRCYLARLLAEHKIPRYIRFRDSLPKSATGKVSRAKLSLVEHP